MKKWIVIAVIVLAGGFAAILKWPGLKPNASAPNELPGRPTTAEVETRSIEFKITAAGEIGPAEQVSVRPGINGRIKTLNVDLGDQVKKGDVLFTLDDSDLQIEKQTRINEIEGAQLQLDKAARNFTRAKEMYEAELISKELFQDTQTEFELAKNSLERAQTSLSLLQDRLKKTKVEAPFDCTVLTRPVSMGQAVSGSGGFNSGTEVLTIADLNNLIVNAHVNQADVTRLSADQVVEIQIESVAGLTLKGKVERIAPQSTLKSNIKGYPARIRIEAKDIDPRIRPGMTANVSIPVASSENSVAVPLAAVFTEQGERFAFVKKDETFERRPIRIGIADYDYAEVLGGLQPGEVVSLEDKGVRAGPGAAGGRPAGLATTPPAKAEGSVSSVEKSRATEAAAQKPPSPAGANGQQTAPVGGSHSPAPGGAGLGGARPTSTTSVAR